LYSEIEQLENSELGVDNDVEEWQFEEDVIEMPAFPEIEKLQQVEIDSSFGGMSFFIDPASLKIGRDEVVLATLVITSKRGARNILFEGFRCDTREYKTFAYGTSNNSFYEVPTAEWKKIWRSRGTTQDFRRELVTTYFCDIERTPLTHDEILRQIQYPEFRDDGGRDF